MSFLWPLAQVIPCPISRKTRHTRGDHLKRTRNTPLFLHPTDSHTKRYYIYYLISLERCLERICRARHLQTRRLHQYRIKSQCKKEKCKRYTPNKLQHQVPAMGVPFSKNNCYEYYGMQIVYNETFARNKEREVHNKKLNEFHSQQEDNLELKYIPVLNTQSNMHGKSFFYSY